MPTDLFRITESPQMLRLSNACVVPGSLKMTCEGNGVKLVTDVADAEGSKVKRHTDRVVSVDVMYAQGFISLELRPQDLPLGVLVHYDHNWDKMLYLDSEGKPLPNSTIALYGWMDVRSEQAHGPFTSKTAAVEDAKGYYQEAEHPTIILGTCKYADPLDYLPDVESLLEGMDEKAFEEDFSWYDDGDIFYTVDSRRAEEGLRQWAKTHLNADRIWTLVEEERIKL
jgi:hypothetical protein